MGMTRDRALRIVEWVIGTLKCSDKEKLSPFEKELYAKCTEPEVLVNGRRWPGISVKDIKPEMVLVLEEGYWKVNSIHIVDNNLYELELSVLEPPVRMKQIIRKRHSTLMAYLR
jgi:hypothetical protein